MQGIFDGAHSLHRRSPKRVPPPFVVVQIVMPAQDIASSEVSSRLDVPQAALVFLAI